MAARREGSRVELENRLRIGATKGLLAWGALTSQEAMLKAPVKTGRLARSIKLGTVEEPTALDFTIAIGTNVEYAAAQEFGSGQFAENPEHRVPFIPIMARRKKSLRFKWPGFPGDPTQSSAYDAESGYFFFKVIKHPGVHPKRYLRGALEAKREPGRRLAVQAVLAEFRK
jgi:hypothetical protein